ncbi:MAG: ADP-ribosylglycohydrolase family protein, partial [Cytophagales bacterium]|nr:ADP-ribosylglycohydrolase family protein [Cytophagales bacterium]
MKLHLLLGLAVLAGWISCQAQVTKISKKELSDKIKGAWVAQAIGVTYGYPYEFKYNSTYMDESIPLEWTPLSLASTYKDAPGAYDDLYVDLTF